MIVREAFGGETRFAGFEKGTGAQPSVVSDRLKRLLEAGILERHEYTAHPPRLEYRLTQKGEDLYPVMMALNKWGDQHLAGEVGPPVVYRHRSCGHDADPTIACGHCRVPLLRSDVDREPEQLASSDVV